MLATTCVGDVVVELAGGVIIEEEQRLGALHDQVVDAHRDQIDADAVVATRFDRKFQLGADPIIRRDEQRIVEPRRLQVEKAAEAAQVGVGAGAPCRSRQRGDGTDQRIAGVDRHARLGISVSGGLVVLGIHGTRD